MNNNNNINKSLNDSKYVTDNNNSIHKYIISEGDFIKVSKNNSKDTQNAKINNKDKKGEENSNGEIIEITKNVEREDSMKKPINNNNRSISVYSEGDFMEKTLNESNVNNNNNLNGQINKNEINESIEIKDGDFIQKSINISNNENINTNVNKLNDSSIVKNGENNNQIMDEQKKEEANKDIQDIKD